MYDSAETYRFIGLQALIPEFISLSVHWMEKLGSSATQFIYEAARNFNSAAKFNKTIIKYQVPFILSI